MRRNTFTKLEGDFETETTSRTEFRQFDQTQRTEIVRRRDDNLTVGEGKFTVSIIIDTTTPIVAYLQKFISI